MWIYDRNNLNITFIMCVCIAYYARFWFRSINQYFITIFILWYISCVKPISNDPCDMLWCNRSLLMVERKSYDHRQRRLAIDGILFQIRLRYSGNNHDLTYDLSMRIKILLVTRYRFNTLRLFVAVVQFIKFYYCSHLLLLLLMLHRFSIAT